VINFFSQLVRQGLPDPPPEVIERWEGYFFKNARLCKRCGLCSLRPKPQGVLDFSDPSPPLDEKNVIYWWERVLSESEKGPDEDTEEESDEDTDEEE
jgi:hypothetical protein